VVEELLRGEAAHPEPAEDDTETPIGGVAAAKV